MARYPTSEHSWPEGKDHPGCKQTLPHGVCDPGEDCATDAEDQRILKLLGQLRLSKRSRD